MRPSALTAPHEPAHGPLTRHPKAVGVDLVAAAVAVAGGEHEAPVARGGESDRAVVAHAQRGALLRSSPAVEAAQDRSGVAGQAGVLEDEQIAAVWCERQAEEHEIGESGEGTVA